MAAQTTARKQPSRSEAAPSADGRAVTSQAPGVVRAYVWRPDGKVAEVDSLDDIHSAYADPDTRVWIDLEDASETTVRSIADCLELHHLIAEDIVERNQRAKVEYTDEIMHLVLFALHYDGELMPVELDIVLGERFLLTSHPPEWRPTEASNIQRNGVGHFLHLGVDHMLWGVVDAAIDGYFPVFDRLGDEMTISRTMSCSAHHPRSWSASSASAASYSPSVTQ